MKINFYPQTFKGYDSCPLKRIHLEESTSDPIKKELQTVAQKEGFELGFGLDYYKWTQDLKTIIEENGQPILIANNRVDKNYLDEVERKYNIKTKQRDLIATGGNSFIGKYPNGEKWLMVGYDELFSKSFDYLEKEYEIKKENIIPIPQQYYHLDMFLRPIGFPYILVDNPDLTREKLAKLSPLNASYDCLTIRQGFKEYETARSKDYASHQSVIKSLENAGFIPIEIAGVFGSGINFMNAIINQHKDGTISYITNSSSCKSEFISNFEKEFEKDLRQKVPNISKVYFIKGKETFVDLMSNYMSDNINYQGGGIHCMTMEEPDFEAWG